jgi:hypothetical protein
VSSATVLNPVPVIVTTVPAETEGGATAAIVTSA